MIVKEEKWQQIPVLHIVDEQFEKSDIPVVIFLHGFTSAKEHNLHYAYNMAKQGLRIILPDAHLHGERAEQLDGVELALRFWEITLTSIEELAFIHQELSKRKLIKEAKIGVGGTSMGAITTLGALTTYDWITVGASMMGMPNYVALAHEQIERFLADGFDVPLTPQELKQLFASLELLDLTKQPAKLNNRPLYFWHGQKDKVVPFAPTYAFYNEVKELYESVPQQLKFTTDKNAGHSVSRQGMLEVTDWFASHLNG